MAEFIRCPCECHTAAIPGEHRCLSGPCCGRAFEPKMCPMLPDENYKPTPPIPWSLAKEIYNLYRVVCTNNQTLEQIAERGGFGYAEIQYIAQKWHKKQAEEAKKRKASGA